MKRHAGKSTVDVESKGHQREGNTPTLFQGFTFCATVFLLSSIGLFAFTNFNAEEPPSFMYNGEKVLGGWEYDSLPDWLHKVIMRYPKLADYVYIKNLTDVQID